MRKLDPEEYEFVAKAWLVAHKKKSDRYAAENWGMVDLKPSTPDDDECFYCRGKVYRVDNAWMFESLGCAPSHLERWGGSGKIDTGSFVTPARIPTEMVAAAKPHWLISDAELIALDDDEKLPVGQRIAIILLLALLCATIFAIVALQWLRF